jgi:hypothetical protein
MHVPFHLNNNTPDPVITMNMQVVRYCLDLSMGIVFLICFVTGIFKFTVLMHILGLTAIIMPLALMSDIHDWSGILLGILVAIHIILNHRWIVDMTRKILRGASSKIDKK